MARCRRIRKKRRRAMNKLKMKKLPIRKIMRKRRRLRSLGMRSRLRPWQATSMGCLTSRRKTRPP